MTGDVDGMAASVGVVVGDAEKIGDDEKTSLRRRGRRHGDT